jgi:hypothetical protein
MPDYFLKLSFCLFFKIYVTLSISFSTSDSAFLFEFRSLLLKFYPDILLILSDRRVYVVPCFKFGFPI